MSTNLGASQLKSTFVLLDEIIAVLGSTSVSLWPFFESTGGDGGVDGGILAYRSGSQNKAWTSRDEIAAVALQSEFNPYRHSGGVFSYVFGAVNQHLSGADHTEFTFGDASIDSPFSVGCWFFHGEAAGTARSLLAKYRRTVVTAREWDFRLDASGNLVLELFDESAAASEIGTGSGVRLENDWNFAVATYDGGETSPVVHLYLNNVDTLASGATTETGAYVAMEDTTTALLLAARNINTSPTQNFLGRIALPFITGIELTAAQVGSLFAIGNTLLGLT